jgi:hypothetical protein
MGALHTSLASNAVEECKKMKNVEKLASEVILFSYGDISMFMIPQLLGQAL